MRQMFERLGFTTAAANAIIRDQGIDSLEEVRLLESSDIETLCKTIRRPGGTIRRGNQDVPNPGISVSALAESNLKIAAWYLMHMHSRVQRTRVPADITRDAIRPFREQMHNEANYEPPTDLPKIDDRDWAKTIEAMEEYLRLIPGERRLPLAYVIRPTIELPEGEDPSTGYVTIEDEMVRRAPIGILAADGTILYDPTFQINNGKTFDKLALWARDHACWTYLKPHAKTRNGRAAWNALVAHFLGPNNVDNAASKAETTLRSLTYSGETRRWTFETYVNKHMQQHTILENLVQHGYAGIDPRSKVRYLCDGIKGTHLDTVKTRILSDETIRVDFPKCVSLFSDFIKQKQAADGPPTRTIAQVSKKRSHNGSSVQVEDRFYNKKEYRALTPDQKSELRRKRLARGHQPGDKSSKKSKPGDDDFKKGIATMSRTIAQTVVTALAAKEKDKTVTFDDDKANSEDESGTGKANSGYTKALTRKK